MLRCCDCGWEGNEEELIKEKAGLYYYDRVLMDSLKGVEVTRVNFLCPVCGSMIKTRRVVNGTVMDK